MTVTIGRRELLAAFGGAARSTVVAVGGRGATLRQPSAQRPIASLRYANPGDVVQAGPRPI